MEEPAGYLLIGSLVLVVLFLSYMTIKRFFTPHSTSLPDQRHEERIRHERRKKAQRLAEQKYREEKEQRYREEESEYRRRQEERSLSYCDNCNTEYPGRCRDCRKCLVCHPPGSHSYYDDQCDDCGWIIYQEDGDD